MTLTNCSIAVLTRRFIRLLWLIACIVAPAELLYATQGLPAEHSGMTSDVSVTSEPARGIDLRAYSLYFSEEFNNSDDGALDKTHWDYDVSYVRGNQLQCFTDGRRENVRVENRTHDGVTGGFLVLQLRKEQWPCPQDNDVIYQYTSGGIASRQRTAGDYLIGADGNTGLPFGVYEIRAKIPAGRGTWPAIWLVGRKAGPDGLNWPEAGEIDIMEAVGFEEANELYRLHSTLHRSPDFLWPDGKGRTGQSMTIDLDEPPSARFHTWTMVWERDSVEIFVDGRRVTRMLVQQEGGSRIVEDRQGFFRFDPGINGTDSLAWPFAKELGNEFYLLLGLAWGGGWGGREGVDDSIFDDGPVEMLVDYVRIYTKDEARAPGMPRNVRTK